jgi:hypothetical protein
MFEALATTFEGKFLMIPGVINLIGAYFVFKWLRGQETEGPRRTLALWVSIVLWVISMCPFLWFGAPHEVWLTMMFGAFLPLLFIGTWKIAKALGKARKLVRELWARIGRAEQRVEALVVEGEEAIQGRISATVGEDKTHEFVRRVRVFFCAALKIAREIFSFIAKLFD